MNFGREKYFRLQAFILIGLEQAKFLDIFCDEGFEIIKNKKK